MPGSFTLDIGRTSREDFTGCSAHSCQESLMKKIENEIEVRTMMIQQSLDHLDSQDMIQLSPDTEEVSKNSRPNALRNVPTYIKYVLKVVVNTYL